MKNEIIDIEEYSENFPNSKKVYVTGSKNNIKVPMRMIEQTTTKLEKSIKSMTRFMFMILLAYIQIKTIE